MNDSLKQKIFESPEPIAVIDFIMLLLALGGFVLNFILLYIILLRRRSKWAIDMTLITIIGVFDTLLCGFMIFSLLYRYIISGDSILNNLSLWCAISSFLFSVSIVVTLIFTSILALVRYLVIVRRHKINSLCWNISCFILLLIAISLFTINISFSKKVVLPSGLSCTPKLRGKKEGVMLFGILVLLLLIMTMFIIPVCYIKVALYYNKLTNSFTSDKTKHGFFCMGFFQTTTLRLLLVVAAYSLALVPETIFTMLSINGWVKITPLIDGIIISLVFSVTITNALLALLVHDETKQELLSLISAKSFKFNHTNKTSQEYILS